MIDTQESEKNFYARAAEESQEAFLLWDFLFYQTMDMMDTIDPKTAFFKVGISPREHFKIQRKLRATIGQHGRPNT